VRAKAHPFRKLHALTDAMKANRNSPLLIGGASVTVAMPKSLHI
jgi:hypothetical protein